MENKESNEDNNSTNINEALLEKTKEEILKKSHIPKNKFNRNYYLLFNFNIIY